MAIAAGAGLLGAGHVPLFRSDRATLVWHMVAKSNSWKVTLDGEVACTSQLQCIAFGSRRGTSLAVRLDGAGIGSETPTRSKVLPDGQLVCSTPFVCLGVRIVRTLSSGHWDTVLLRTSDGGVAWTAETLPSSLHVTGLACATTLRCLVIGKWGTWSPNGGTAANRTYVTTDGGREWSEAASFTLPYELSPIVQLSCATNGACLVSPFPTSNDDHIEVTKNFGSSWQQISIAGNPQVIGVSCSEGNSCAALTVRWNTSSNTGRASLWAIDASRSEVTSHHLLPGALESIGMDSFTCRTSAICFVSGSTASITNLLYSTSNDGSSWLTDSLPSGLGGTSWVECAANERCVATGNASAGSTPVAIRS